jgi:hypothetical protein
MRRVSGRFFIALRVIASENERDETHTGVLLRLD